MKTASRMIMMAIAATPRIGSMPAGPACEVVVEVVGLVYVVVSVGVGVMVVVEAGVVALVVTEVGVVGLAELVIVVAVVVDTGLMSTVSLTTTLSRAGPTSDPNMKCLEVVCCMSIAFIRSVPLT